MIVVTASTPTKRKTLVGISPFVGQTALAAEQRLCFGAGKVPLGLRIGDYRLRICSRGLKRPECPHLGHRN